MVKTFELFALPGSGDTKTLNPRHLHYLIFLFCNCILCDHEKWRLLPLFCQFQGHLHPEGRGSASGGLHPRGGGVGRGEVGQTSHRNCNKQLDSLLIQNLCKHFFAKFMQICLIRENNHILSLVFKYIAWLIVESLNHLQYNKKETTEYFKSLLNTSKYQLSTLTTVWMLEQQK